MKTLFLSFALFALVAVAPAFAGGDPDQLGANLYDDNGMLIDGSVSADSAAVTTEEPEMSADQLAAAARSARLWQIALVVLIVGGGAGLLYWSSRRNKVI